MSANHPVLPEGGLEGDAGLARLLLAVNDRLRDEDSASGEAAFAVRDNTTATSTSSASASAIADAPQSTPACAAPSSTSTSPETPQRSTTRISLPGARVGTKMVSVFLLKSIPCSICLADLTSSIRSFARSRGSDLLKELVPVWDKCMVYVELTDKVKISEGDCVVVGASGVKVVMEPASNPSVDPVPASPILQLRCIVLAPNKDYKHAVAEQFDAYKLVVGRRSKKVKGACIRLLASQLGVEWSEAAVPTNAVRSTKPTTTRPPESCRRAFVHMLVKTKEVMTQEQLAEVDGKRIDVNGLQCILRVEYARTFSIDSKVEDDTKWNVVTQSAVVDTVVESLHDVFEIPENVSSRARRCGARRSGKRRGGAKASCDDDDDLDMMPQLSDE